MASQSLSFTCRTPGPKVERRSIVVDGQQRIRAVLDFIYGKYELSGDEITKQWEGLSFEDLGGDEKKSIYSYKFVVRVLPEMDNEGLRKIFTRLNRNVVSLNTQELRNATYWGPFIKTIQQMADEIPFWSESGLFSANDHRRMLDHEFISELAIAYLHGLQNKKDKLDHYYQLYEENFEAQKELLDTFTKVTAEISQVIPELSRTRWKKKSDFYTLFLCFSEKVKELPWSRDERASINEKIITLGEKVDELSRLEEEEPAKVDPRVKSYFLGVSRAASDRGSRATRQEAFINYVFGRE